MHTHTSKLVVIGDSGVGKSSLVRRYLLNLNSPIPTYSDHPRIESTIGAAYYVVILDNLKLQIWDTAGQERFRSLCPIYFRASSGCICVFDVTNRKSFENVDDWIRSFLDNAPIQNISNSSNLQVLLVANKTDLNYSEWAVSIDEISMKAKSLNCPFILTSVVNMFNFDKFCEYIRYQYLNLAPKTPNTIIIPEHKSDPSCISNCVD